MAMTCVCTLLISLMVNKLEDLELKINFELVSIPMLYNVPENYEPFRFAIEIQEKLFSPEE